MTIFFFWFLTFINIIIVKLYFSAFGINIYLPIASSLVVCVITYLNLEHKSIKKHFSWYLMLFSNNLVLISFISFFYMILFDNIEDLKNSYLFLHFFYIAFIQIFSLPMGGPIDYTLMSSTGNPSIPIGATAGSISFPGNYYIPTGTTIGSTNISSNSSIHTGARAGYIQPNTIPLDASQMYEHRNVRSIESLNYYNPKDWSIADRLRLVEKLETQFFQYSLDPLTKAEVAMFKDVLRDNNVQDSWVAFNNSSTNKPPLYLAFRNSSYQDMIIAKKQSLQQQSKFLVTPHRSILN